MALYALGGILVIALIVLTVTQCADEEAEPAATGGAATMERQVITDGLPNAYLVQPGVIEVAK